MVGKTGFEPATTWSQTKCSTKLSYFPIGCPAGIRTPNPIPYIPSPVSRQNANRYCVLFLTFKLCQGHNGGSGWNRTSDTGIFSPLLYQLSYRAISILIFSIRMYCFILLLAFSIVYPYCSTIIPSTFSWITKELSSFNN